MTQIVLVMHTLRQLHFRVIHGQIGHLVQQVGDAVQAGLFLSSARTIHQGDSGMWVRSSMTSLACVYASQRRRLSRSIGLSFHCLSGSLMRLSKRASCSLSDTENQYLMIWMPLRASIFSNSGAERKNSSYSASLQSP